MIDWLKKRLSPVKRETSRWQELAEAIQEFWAAHFEPAFDSLAGLMSIYTADAEGQERILSEMGAYFEAGILDETNIPYAVAMRGTELQQKETDMPLVRAMARIGFTGRWEPLYAPRGEIYGTAFYTEDELPEHGLSIDAIPAGLDGTWGLSDEPPVTLSADGVYMTSRAKMILDFSSARAAGLMDAARRTIMQLKPLHIVYDGFHYCLVLEFSARPSHTMSLLLRKTIEQDYPWGTPKLNGLWQIGTDETESRLLDGSWQVGDGTTLGDFLVPGIVYEQLSQRNITSTFWMKKESERPADNVTARLGESLLKLDGNWRVGRNRILTLADIRKIYVQLGAAIASLDGARAVDGSWAVGATKQLDGSWRVGDGRA